MARICRCGAQLQSVLEEWGCLHCGGICCPTCGYTPEGSAYCPECAQGLFNVYTRPSMVSRRKPISAWWEAAAVQPVQAQTVGASLGRLR